MIGGVLGELLVMLGVDSSDLHKGVNDANKRLKSLNKTAKMVNRTLTGLISFVAIRRVWRMSEAWEKLYRAQEQAGAGLAQALRSTGRYSEKLHSDLIKLSRDIQKVTNISDEATLAGLRMLVAYEKIPTELIPRVAWAMADMSNLTGRTMEQSAKMFGKSTLDMIGELRRLGVAINAITYEELGFAGALAQTEKMFHGQAKAIGATRTGQLQIYANMVRMLKEDLGSFVTELKLSFTPTLTTAIIQFDDWYRKQVEMKRLGMDNVFDDIANSTNRLVSVLERLISLDYSGPLHFFGEMAKYWELWTGMAIGGKLGGPLGALIGTGAGGFYSAYKDWKELAPAALGDIPENRKRRRLANEFNTLMDELHSGILGQPSERRVQEIYSRLRDIESYLTTGKFLLEGPPKPEYVPKAMQLTAKDFIYEPPEVPPPEYLEFQQDYRKATKTTMEYELYLLDKNVAKYEEAIQEKHDKEIRQLDETKQRYAELTDDKIGLDKWYNKEAIAIDEKTAKDRSMLQELFLAGLADINAPSLKALEEERVKAAERERKERLETLNVFNEDYKRTTMTQLEYEIDLLNRQRDEYEKYVKDKVKLDKWYTKRGNEIYERWEKENVERMKTYSELFSEGWESFGRSFGDTLIEMAHGADVSFKDILDSFTRMIARMVWEKEIMEPIFNRSTKSGRATWGSLGSFLGGLFSEKKEETEIIEVAKGGAFEYGRMMKLARGGVVDHPIIFPMQHGEYGMMGEDGPEAVLPLARLPGGDLGVKSSGKGGDTYVFNVTTIDAQSFGQYFDEFTRNNPGAVLNPIVDARRKGVRI